MFFKIGPLENFANYSVKHPRWSLLPIRDSNTSSCNPRKTSKNTPFYRTNSMAVARERQNMTLVQKSEGNSHIVGPKRGDYSEQINHKTK